MEKDNYISLSDCRNRGIYRLGSRNLSLGVYNEASKGFIGIREKFGDFYLFTEYHWDNGAPFGTVRPYECIGQLPDDIELRETVNTFDQVTHRLVEFDKEVEEGRPKGWFFLDTGEYSRNILPCTGTYKPLFDYLLPLDSVVSQSDELP